MNRLIPLFLVAALLLPAAAEAALLPEEQQAIKVFKDASASVVFVTKMRVARNFHFDEFSVPQGSGSGFVWDDKGHIVTNYHVVRGGDAFLVTLDDGTQLEARLIGAEPRKDIAVLKVGKSLNKLRPVVVGSAKGLQVGQKTIAIGNPFGLDHTMTVGIVSALGREVQGMGGVTIRDMIQTDAAINPGNSGGPLLDSSGKLIGMNTMIYSRNGSNSGIGFAVPVTHIKRLVPQLIRHGKAIQPGIGVSVLRAGRRYKGVVVQEVLPDSPAARAGIRGLSRNFEGRLVLGDIIVGVDEHKILDYDDLYNTLDAYRVGDRVALKIRRGRKTRTVKIRLVSIY